MSVRILELAQKSEYNRYAAHPLQSWAWGDFREENGQKIIRVGRFHKEELIESHQISLHRIPYTPYSVGYCPRGPLPSEEVLNFLKKEMHKRKVLAVKFEPQLFTIVDENGEVQKPKSESKVPASKEDLGPQLTRLGLRPGKSQFAQHSFILDISKQEEELLASFASKTRYNIRLAARKGVRIVEASDEEGLDIFLKLLEETSRRQGFYVHSRSYYQKLFETLNKNKNIHILHAVYGEGENEEILSAWVLFSWKNALYYPYGASTTARRELMANNLIMWEAIRLGKKLNLEYFDMWGSLGPDASARDPWFGFHRFKKGYSPDLCRFVGAWDLIIYPLHWKLFNALDALRWKILRHRKRAR